jgi:hypothetical protein
MPNPFDLGYIPEYDQLDGIGSKLKKAVKKVGKKVEKTVKKVSQKTLGKSVTAKLSKVVQNPVFKTVAIGLATAGAVSVLSKTSMVAKLSGAKKLTSTSKVISSVVKTKKGLAAIKKGAKVAKSVAVSPEAQNVVQSMIDAGKTPAQIEQAWVGSESYKGATAQAIDASMRGAIADQLRRQGVPSSALPEATEQAVAQLTNNAVEEQQGMTTLGKAALFGIPVLFALMGG